MVKIYKPRCLRSTMVLVVIFPIFEIIIFCFVVAICDLEHDVEAIFHIP